MKIDASRFVMFWTNPERYRLREIWKLAPEPPGQKSFQFLLETGRRRGHLFHEILDLQQKGVSNENIREQLEINGGAEKEVDRAFQMAELANAHHPGDGILAHEAYFEAAIPESPHSLVGRIDRICEIEGETAIVDYKTSKYRPKRDILALGDKYCRSIQAGFYFLGARSLGFSPAYFEYRVVSSKSGGDGFQTQAFRAFRSGSELKQLQRSVHVTCELIRFLMEMYGTEQHWPVLPEMCKTGYEEITGRRMFPDVTPDGFQRAVEHLKELEAEDAEPEE